MPNSSRGPRGRRRRRWAWVVLVLIGLAGAGAAGTWLFLILKRQSGQSSSAAFLAVAGFLAAAVQVLFAGLQLRQGSHHVPTELLDPRERRERKARDLLRQHLARQDRLRRMDDQATSALALRVRPAIDLPHPPSPTAAFSAKAHSGSGRLRYRFLPRPRRDQPGEVRTLDRDLPTFVDRDMGPKITSWMRKAREDGGFLVLVGDSSVGKTRLLYEMAHDVLRDFAVLSPDLGDGGLVNSVAAATFPLPKLIVWLDELQRFLDGPYLTPGSTPITAAALRHLLDSPTPVVVLGAMWPEHATELRATEPDPRTSEQRLRYPSAADILGDSRVRQETLASFSRIEREAAANVASHDPRLAEALADRDYNVTEVLAGAPQLVARYEQASEEQQAVLDAALDARRLGIQAPLIDPLLCGAARGYLSTLHADDMWFPLALTELTRHDGPQDRATAPLIPVLSEEKDKILGYTVADYLDHYGRNRRKTQVPPATFWAAAAHFAFPADQAELGDAAHALGLYRDAAQLHKNAAARGNALAALYLSHSRAKHYFSADIRPARWAVAHVSLDEPGAVALLLLGLREAGAREQVAALLRRDPAAHVSLDDPRAVAVLLFSLHQAGAQEQVTVLADRAAAHVSLDDPRAAAVLLGSLREAGAQEQVTALLRRDPAAHLFLDDSNAVAGLLFSLRRAGAHEQGTALLRRDPAAHVSLDDPDAVAWLLGGLHEAGAQEQVTVLADRAVAHVSLDDPDAVAVLLGNLREAGAQEQVTALLQHDLAARVSLDDPGAVADLLGSLRKAGAQDQVTVLADRAAANASLATPLNDPLGVERLLGSLWQAGAREQVTVLASRAAANAPLDDPGAVARLLRGLRGLDNLRQAGAQEQITALLRRHPAAHASLNDPRAVGQLLLSLRAAGAQEQVTVLASRAAANVLLDDPTAVEALVDSLRWVSAQEQVTVLASRAAANVPLDDTDAVARLLSSLRDAGAQKQATALADRLPEAGMFELFREQEHCQERFRFGRELDGSPAKPWDWEDLD
jgi:hypothetical protein